MSSLPSRFLPRTGQPALRLFPLPGALCLLLVLSALTDVGAAPRRLRLGYGMENAAVRAEGTGAGIAQLAATRAGLEESARLYSVRGAQVYAFRLDGARAGHMSFAFGYRDPRKADFVEEDTLLPAGELVRPLLAVATLRNGFAPAAPVRPHLKGELRARVTDTLTVEHLLAHTSAAAAAETGYAPPNRAATDLGAYLSAQLQFRGEPGRDYRPSFANYALLQYLLAQNDPQLLEQQLQKNVFRPLMMRASVLVPSEPYAYSPGMVRSGRYYFGLKDDTAVPGANRMFVSARDYARFLRELSAGRDPAGVPAGMLLRPVFAFDEQLGGSALGFPYLRTAGGRVWYRAESVIPGSAGVAMFVPGVGGAVILAVPSDVAFVRDMLALLSTHMFADIFSESEIPKRKRAPVVPTRPAFVPVEVAPLRAKYGELEGQYRPVAALPLGQRLLAFMNDTRFTFSTKHGLELSGVFQEEAAVELVPLEPDLFLARGNARMHGWRVRVLRDADGRVSGLASDGMRFNRVPLLLSFWGVILLVSFSVILPLLGALLFLIRRSAGPSTVPLASPDAGGAT